MRLTKIHSKHILTAILVISVIARVGGAVLLGDEVVNLPGTFDQISYHNLALRVIGGHGFSFGEAWWPLTAANAPTAHWSFLYTLYLCGVYLLFGPHPLAARLIQAVIVGVLHPLLVYWIGRRVFNETIGLVGAGATAVYAYFIYYSGTLMTEPFYITAILAAVSLSLTLTERVSAQRQQAVGPVLRVAAGLGVVLGCIVLLRQVFLLFVPFLFLWILWVQRKKNLALTVGALALSGALVAAMILPFTAFNYARFKSFVLLNTNAGYAFFYANHPIYGSQFVPILTPEMGTYQDLIPTELRHLDEAALDKALLSRGMQFVVEAPGRYLLLSLSRLPVFFMFWPSSESGTISNISRVGSFGIFWPFMLYGVLMAIFSRRHPLRIDSPVFLMLAFTLVYTGIHILSWSLIRYRLPVDALLLLFAGLALVDIFQRVQAWRRPGAKTPKPAHQA